MDTSTKRKKSIYKQTHNTNNFNAKKFLQKHCKIQKTKLNHPSVSMLETWGNI